MPERHVTDTPYQPRDQRDSSPPQPRPPVPTQRSRTTRAMGVIMMALGIGWLAIALHEGAPAPAEVEVPPSDGNQLISQSYPTHNIAFDISGGDVTISTWGEKTTQVEVFYQGGEPADYDVRPQAQGDTLIIQGGPKAFLPVSGDRQISYHITIPQDGSVTVKNVTGDTSIADVQGQVSINVNTGQIHAERLGHGLSATTTTGDIQIDGLRGPLTAQSTTGSITLSDGNVSDASVTTVAGNIELSGVSGKIALENSTGTIRVSEAKDTVLSIQTVSGDIDFDGSLATKAKHALNTVSGSVQMRIPEKSDLVLHAGTSSGGIEIDSDLNLQKREDNQFSQSGVLGDGGAELEINTVSGGITINGE